MKKSKLRKVSKQKISTLQVKLWQKCKEIIRKKYRNICYTCHQPGLSGSNWHTGHLWAKASLGAFLKYDLRILRPQCYNCNINRGGMGADFYKRMLEEIGPERMQELEADRKVIVKSADHYQKTLLEYTEIIKEL